MKAWMATNNTTSMGGEGIKGTNTRVRNRKEIPLKDAELPRGCHPGVEMVTKPMLIAHIHEIKIQVGNGDTVAISRVIQLRITPIPLLNQLQTIKKLERPSVRIAMIPVTRLKIVAVTSRASRVINRQALLNIKTRRYSIIIDFGSGVILTRENTPIPEFKPTKWKYGNIDVRSHRMSTIEN
ncbi:hypothetical protein PR048_005390 [Dryococelus australis]|uniref:Uncharacterized protein n=1 Tax=Dryococelus australis TaxID=614101 RepID=A0ABQ9I941_9NEOP|nr:hypothetical protein PR048_005390 [Dryococelus australis]